MTHGFVVLPVARCIDARGERSRAWVSPCRAQFARSGGGWLKPAVPLIGPPGRLHLKEWITSLRACCGCLAMQMEFSARTRALAHSCRMDVLFGQYTAQYVATRSDVDPLRKPIETRA